MMKNFNTLPSEMRRMDSGRLSQCLIFEGSFNFLDFCFSTKSDCLVCLVFWFFGVFFFFWGGGCLFFVLVF